jgi:hypothetical protein
MNLVQAKNQVAQKDGYRDFEAVPKHLRQEYSDRAAYEMLEYFTEKTEETVNDRRRNLERIIENQPTLFEGFDFGFGSSSVYCCFGQFFVQDDVTNIIRVYKLKNVAYHLFVETFDTQLRKMLSVDSSYQITKADMFLYVVENPRHIEEVK